MSDLHIARVFDASVEKVWQAWTEPELIKKWWGSKYFTAPVIKNDLRVGGKYLYCMRGKPGPEAPEQDFWSTGEYLEVEKFKKIVATDNFADKDGNIISPNAVGMPGVWDEEMRVEVIFEDMGDGKTKVRITHSGHPAEIMDAATQGWNQSLDKLAESLK